MTQDHIPIPIDEMSEFLAVDPTSSTGLRWIQSPAWSTEEGSEAGRQVAIRNNLQVGFRGRRYTASRIVYAMHHGVDPGLLEVVHIDGDIRNNMTTNLKLMPVRGYRQSTPKKSGLPTGVCRTGRRNKPYKSYVYVNNKQRFLGEFGTLEEAAAAYQKALASLLPQVQ